MSVCKRTGCGNYDFKYVNHCHALTTVIKRMITDGCPFLTDRATKRKCLEKQVQISALLRDGRETNKAMRDLERFEAFWAETPLDSE